MTAPLWGLRCIFQTPNDRSTVGRSPVHTLSWWLSTPENIWLSVWSRRRQGGQLSQQGPARRQHSEVASTVEMQTKVLPQNPNFWHQPTAWKWSKVPLQRHILFYECCQGKKKKSIHKMERQRILINSIIRAKAIMLHVSWSPPEKWKRVWWKKATVLISVILKTSEHRETH